MGGRNSIPTPAQSLFRCTIFYHHLNNIALKKLSLIILLNFICIYTFAQAENKIEIGTIDSIQSKILNEKRKIWIYIPKGIDDSTFLPQRYPVVYLLDGNSNFSSVVGMLQKLSGGLNSVCPQMIVVGIPNTKRTRDLTPTKPVTDTSNSSGGGELFISFIEKELMPYIDSVYPTQPYKMLIGHSFGGLTVMNALLNHTKLFNSYISIDPSMWWDKQNLLKASKKLFLQNSFVGKSLFVGIANTMETGINLNDIVNDTTSKTLHIRSILEMDKFIKTQNPQGLNYASKYYENDDHGSVQLITEYDALRFIFNRYSLRLSVSNKEYNDSTFDIADRIDFHFKQVSEFMGYKVMMPENLLNAEASRLFRLKQYIKTEGLLNLYIDSYPKSANGYDFYGDYYIAIGDKLKAIEYFKKALTIKESTETKKKLNKLLE